MGGQVDPHNKVLGLRGGRREDEKELNSLGLEEFSGCLRRMEPNQAQDRSGQEKKAASESIMWTLFRFTFLIKSIK